MNAEDIIASIDDAIGGYVFEKSIGQWRGKRLRERPFYNGSRQFSLVWENDNGRGGSELSYTLAEVVKKVMDNSLLLTVADFEVAVSAESHQIEATRNSEIERRVAMANALIDGQIAELESNKSREIEKARLIG